MSPLVTALTLTCESKAKPDLYALAQELTDGAYQNTLQNVVTRHLIPWLGTIVTLRFILLVTNLARLAHRSPPFHSQLQFRPLLSHCRSGRTSSD